MSGDYSRIAAAPSEAVEHYTALLLQQGRVLLDADFNEAVAILKRRIEKLSLDTLGNPGVAQASTPDAFQVSATAAGTDLVLAPGRLYVDGWLAEIFEGETVTYLGQPFLPDPPELPEGAAAIYLEVWEEELTWIEAPLLDAALGGVDTSTRLRTIFQLHAAEVEAARCGIDVGPPPSAGRLTTRGINPPDPNDPCLLPPVAGYRGLENRLYRVEVHEGGPMGMARFKWSRDNGSIMAPVSAVGVEDGRSVLSVGRIGRDPVMRFTPGDWVTVTDDHRTWMDEPGEMASVFGIDEAEGTITLDRDIAATGNRPFALDSAGHAARHTRVQKWDQAEGPNDLDDEGLLTIGPEPMVIEAGIQLTFAAAPEDGAFRRGDYWVFWARTATAAIEEFTEAPPRGIVRRYVQLAAADGLGAPDPRITPCLPRPEARGEGCCTVVVGAGDDVQAAIDALPQEGGCVCLKPGLHQLPDTLRIDRANVHMHGESLGAILQGTAPVLAMSGARAIRIEMVTFSARVSDETAIVSVADGDDIAIADCRIAPLRPTFGGTGIRFFRTDGARVTTTMITNTHFGIVVQGFSNLPEFVDNVLLFVPGPDDPAAPIGVWTAGSPSAARIKGNIILGAHVAVAVNDQPADVPSSSAASSYVVENLIVSGGIAATGQSRAIGIDAAADFMTVSGNNVVVAADGGIGIRATGAGSTVIENKLAGLASAERPAIGVQVGAEDEGSGGVASDIIVSMNQIAGQVIGTVVSGALAAGVSRNTIRVLQAPFGILALNASDLRVEDNRISGAEVGISVTRGRASRVAGNDIHGGIGGIIVAEDSGATLSGNHVTSPSSFGIMVQEMLGQTVLRGNRIREAGAAVPRAIGLGAFLNAGEWHVEGNEVLDTGLGGDDQTVAWGIWGDLILSARVAGNLVTYTDPLTRDVAREDRALLMRGLLEFAISLGPNEDVAGIGFPIRISDNNFAGTGASALVELTEGAINDSVRMRFERVLFTGNHCLHVCGPVDDRRATVVLTGRAAVVANNQIKATVRNFFSVDFGGMPGPFIGNVLSGGALGYPGLAAAPDGQHNLMI